MAKHTQALEDALRYTLTEANLPSAYPDFESLTREIVRRIAPYAVIVDRKKYTDLTRPNTGGSKELQAAIDRYKAHNDSVEASLRERRSNPPSAPRIFVKGK